MNFLLDNWDIIILAIALIVCGVAAIWGFLAQPTAKQKRQILQWLVWAVTEAEKSLGSGTGKLKLSMVYEKFVVAFPWLAKIISVESFGELVDDALETMRHLIENNPSAAAIVNSDQE